MSRLTHYAGGVALVHHHQGVIFLCQVADLVHRCYIAIHREDSIGGDDAITASLSLLKTTLQVCHVSILIAESLCLAESHAVDDRCMVQGIADDGILFGEKGLEESAVGIKAGCIEDCVFGLEVVADGSLQFFVHILCATDKSYR